MHNEEMPNFNFCAATTATAAVITDLLYQLAVFLSPK